MSQPAYRATHVRKEAALCTRPLLSTAHCPAGLCHRLCHRLHCAPGLCYNTLL